MCNFVDKIYRTEAIDNPGHESYADTLFIITLKPVSYLLYSYIFCSITIQTLSFVEDKFRFLVNVRTIVLTCKL